MYAKTLLVAAMAALTLAACDKDEVNNNKENPTPMPVPGQVQQTAKVVSVKNLGMSTGDGAYELDLRESCHWRTRNSS